MKAGNELPWLPPVGTEEGSVYAAEPAFAEAEESTWDTWDAKSEFIATTVVTTALAQNRLSGLSAVLESIAQAFRACGCILWEVEPGANLASELPEGRLCVLAEWMEDRTLRTAPYELPLDRSLTGRAVLSGRTQVAPEVKSDKRIFRIEGNEDFFRRTGADTLCSVPFTISDSLGGALNIYRRERQTFSPQEVKQLEKVARLLPGLYRALRDRISFSLLSRGNEILSQVQGNAEDSEEDLTSLYAAFHLLCGEITAAFECEVSLFLEDPNENPDYFDRITTTSPERATIAYKRSVKPSELLTAWVLQSGKTLRLLDLRFFPRDLNRIGNPDISQTSLDSIRTSVEHGCHTDADLPPLSFLAVPIFVGQRVVGTIRCFAATGPYYFGDREQALLELLARQIGARWGDWLHRRDQLKESRAWQALVTGVAALNLYTCQILSQTLPNERFILEKALRITHSVIEGAESSAIWLYDGEQKDLYLAAFHGRLRNSRNSEGGERRISLSAPPARTSSVAEWVFRNNEIYVDADTRKVGAILAPISVERRVFGVLEISGKEASGVPAYAAQIAELLGKQMGLYQYLTVTIEELRKTKTELADKFAEVKELQSTQQQVFEDMAHQLHSPIVQAHYRVNSISGGPIAGIERYTERQFLAIRGLLGKAERVTHSLPLFVALARGEEFQVRPTLITQELLISLLIQAAEDTELLMDPERGIRFVVDRRSFEIFDRRKVVFDRRLLEQAIGNIFDNAGKYSFSKNTVRIFGGETGKGRVHVTVANRGLRLRSEEIALAKMRGWRGEFAEMTTQEGSGIGLWLVDHIMQAHGGELILTATDLSGRTEVKLVFP